MIHYEAIDKSWTLFLDRDGVINQDKEGDYIRHAGEFFFLAGAEEAIQFFNGLFGTIVVVTNQKGIGKGLMTEHDLKGIHDLMQSSLEKIGARIDKIYFAPDLNNNSINRKPNPGMAFQAKADFPHIDFSKSIMVGNKLSDMEFGRNAGMATVFLATTNPETAFPHPFVDERYDSLAGFAHSVKASTKP